MTGIFFKGKPCFGKCIHQTCLKRTFGVFHPLFSVARFTVAMSSQALETLKQSSPTSAPLKHFEDLEKLRRNILETVSAGQVSQNNRSYRVGGRVLSRRHMENCYFLQLDMIVGKFSLFLESLRMPKKIGCYRGQCEKW